MRWFYVATAFRAWCRQNAKRVLRGALWAGIVCVLMGGAVRAEVLVTDVSLASRSDGNGYVMRVHTTAPVEAYSMPRSVGTHQLKWVLYNTGLHEDYQAPAPEGPVKRYSTTQRNGHLILRLRLAKDQSVSATAYRDGASDDLLLNLTYEGERPVAEAPSNGGSPANAESQNNPNPTPRGSRERSRLDTVVIDPGHGGKDPGAVANGLQEKDIVLDVAHKLGDYIENRLDLEVVYTRTEDRFIPLEERGQYANRVGGDLFISLHVNAAPTPAAQGTETYFLGRSKTDAARRVVRRENSVVQRYEKNPDRYDEYDEETFVRGELFLSANMKFSEEFAKTVQHQFEHRVKREDRGVRQAGFYVLWSASMPSVLVELGFLTNSGEARFLNSKRGQAYLASAIFRAVRDYKGKYNKGIAASE